MFNRRREEISILEKSLERLEQSHMKTEEIIESFCKTLDLVVDYSKVRDEAFLRSLDLITNSLNNNIEKSSNGYLLQQDEFELDENKIRAAYALNLCTVSISQIIDYDDENILEQEYETILNNLNLENIPKDEVLLNILKQMLDTISFFRIQEGDKYFIEKEYQQKVKNAIWSGVPNIGLIVSGGNPFTMIASLATQVGIGYMNYRRTKAENALVKAKSQWQLQRAAIEQFNGIRRELFDASWRLAEKYNFPDKYRLTEYQISQYNRILMDTNITRRYERLEAIESYFIAYPPFWYYFGHTATEIASEVDFSGDNDYCDKYKKNAIKHFEQYMESNKYALLREDQITSSCALEYIELLDPKSDSAKILELLEYSIEASGRKCDVLQLCVISYLKINNVELAVKWLKYLVNENFNTVMNAQILSRIYVGFYIENHINKNKFETEYRILEKKVTSRFLFPFPKDISSNLNNLNNEFITNIRGVLLENFRYTIDQYYEKATINFNKLLFLIERRDDSEDIFFSDKKIYRLERLKVYRELISDKKNYDYINELIQSNIVLTYIEFLNQMINDIVGIIPTKFMNNDDIIDKLNKSIESKIVENKELLATFQNERMGMSLGFKEFENLFNLSLDVLSGDFYEMLFERIVEYVNQIQDMSIISEIELLLSNYRLEFGIPEYHLRINTKEKNHYEITKKERYLSIELLGKDAIRKSEMLSKAKKMGSYIEGKIEEIITSSGRKKNIEFITICNSPLKNKFDNYFKVYGKLFDVGNDEFVGILGQIPNGFETIVFTTSGVILDSFFKLSNFSIIPYSSIKMSENKLIINNKYYTNKDVNIKELFNLIHELAWNDEFKNPDCQ